MGRVIRTPAAGQEVRVHAHDGDYRVTGPRYRDGDTLGWLRSAPHGSRRVWGWAIHYNDGFQGRYADMAHAVQGLLAAIAKATSPSASIGGS